MASGHLGSYSTPKRISAHFVWPGIAKNTRDYIKSCDTCQKRVSKGRVSRVKISEIRKQAQHSVKEKAETYTYDVDRKLKMRKFQVKDEVLILLPDDSNSLLMTWKGPYKIKAVKSGVNYEIKMGQNTKIFHANMIKKYHRRSKTNPI